MPRLRPIVFALLLMAPALVGAQRPQPTGSSSPARGTKLLTTRDLTSWKGVRNPTVSADGRWFAYVLAPNEGDAEVVVRATADGGKESRFPIGEAPAGGFGGQPGGRGGRGRPSAAGPLQLSADGKWLAFTIYPSHREAQRLRQQRRPLENKMAIVNLSTGEKSEFDKIRRFAFNDEKATWIAMQAYAPNAAPGASAQPGAAGAQNAPAAPRVGGSDLLLYRLANGETVNIGNVLDFEFDDGGKFLAYTIDARDEIGNGVQLRSLTTDVVRALDADRALYRQLTWADSGLALAVLRGKADTVARDTLWSVVTFTNFTPADAATKTVFDPRSAADFPPGMKVSQDRAPAFASDFSAVFFGIREARKPEPRETMAGRQGGRGDASARGNPVQAGAPGPGGTINQPRAGANGDDELPSLVLWNARDARLQSQQIVQEQQDKQFSYLSEYRFAEHRFVRLSDDALRAVTPMPKEHYAIGTDSREYDQPASYNGRSYRDVYGVDLATGTRKLLLKKHHSLAIPSPDGRHLLVWGKDGQYHVIDVATGADRNITQNLATSFVDVEDDHNNLYPPAFNPLQANLGWTRDGSAVLLSDGWDVWKVPAAATGAAMNLTGDGRATKMRYQRRYTFDPREKGIDLAKPLYFSVYGEWTKKNGIARVDPNRTGATRLVFDDASYGYIKASDADTYLYTRQTFSDFPDWYVASADLRSGRRITDANPQQKDFAWSSGARLVSYVSDKGDSLQAAMFLPANYEPGKKYPMLVTIYEKLSQGLHQYAQPSATRTPDPSVYTNRGYVVLAPDIVYKVNDPGMSAVWCVVPAVKAAIATGIVDSSRVGLWGHSWGGYQTAFLVTQTKIFAAAIAGAPLTDMVSMYSSIYWNTGGANQAIFESSQGRFKGNFLENYDAYIRNSPAFHANDVTTPLVILHNDKDGAVDFNQGITYFNTLRQLGKDVILLEYVGENHGLQRPVNQKDYAIRMGEWFDHWLLGKPAPDWMTNGIPRLQMEDHLKARRPRDDTPEPSVVPHE